MSAELPSGVIGHPPDAAATWSDPPNRAGYAEVYQLGYGRLCNQLYAYLGDREEAQDIAQEAYLRAWQKWRTVIRYEDPQAWIRRVAWNLATSRFRRLAVAARHLTRHRFVESVDAIGPEHVALVAALRTVPVQLRQALVMHYLADMTVADIALDLDVPRGTVLSWLHRGRAKLATTMGTSTSPDHSQPPQFGKAVNNG
jgi:RNA polymerase sigma-70 factor, ECF subfamily